MYIYREREPREENKGREQGERQNSRTSKLLKEEQQQSRERENFKALKQYKTIRVCKTI